MNEEDVRRIPPDEARRRAENGALLVCAYDDEDKCRDMLLDGAITLGRLRELEPAKGREIIFYCA